MKLPEPPLLLITDRKQAAHPLADVVSAALSAGCRWVSIREKDLPEVEQERLAGMLLPIARRFAARLTIHGNVDLAVKLDGVHLPDGGDAREARARLGPNKLIGLSVHAPEQARAADPSLLDYLIAGPVYDTASKAGYGPAIGAKGFAAFVQATSLPVFGIGGIERPNIREVIAAGAAGIAVMGSVMRTADPAGTMQALIGSLEKATR